MVKEPGFQNAETGTQSILKKIISLGQEADEIKPDAKNSVYKRSIIKEPDDVFFCTWPELFSVLSGECIRSNGYAERRTENSSG